ncbi:MAG: hypothetical protein PVJ67_02375 [Candidatus Pacearchaeota archaeon]|jgi:hypothetical protein
MLKKKGLSTIVTTLIIILLVLVAIGIVWVVIANLVQEGGEQIFLDKFTTSLDIKNVNVDNSTDYAEIDVKRNAGKGDLYGLKFIVNDGQNSEVFEFDDISLQELGQKRFNFTLAQLDIDNVQTISIAPIYKSDSGKTITGGIIAFYRLNVAGGGASVNCPSFCSDNSYTCGYYSVNGSTCGCGSCSSGYHCNTSIGSCEIDTATCDLTNAFWSTLSVVDGATVSMNLQGTDCDGKDIWFQIWEYDFLVSDDLVPTSPTNPANITFSGTSSSGSWIASWTYVGDDDVGIDPRDYYFIAYVAGESESIISSGGTLAVSNGSSQPCSGDICVGAETCGGTILVASDSTRCCNQTCTSPAISMMYREFSSSTISPGGTMNIDVYVYLQSGEEYYALEEYIPVGWTITDDDGGYGNSTRLAWVWIDNFSLSPYDVRNDPFTYTVQAPTTPGTYNFGGVYGLEGGSVTTTLGNTSITVA